MTAPGRPGVLPRSAPSMTASAGAVSTRPRPANDATTSAVAVLLCRMRGDASPARKAVRRLRSEIRSRCRRSAPNTRMMPVRTMRVPHSSSATAPSSSIRMSVAELASGRLATSIRASLVRAIGRAPSATLDRRRQFRSDRLTPAHRAPQSTARSRLRGSKGAEETLPSGLPSRWRAARASTDRHTRLSRPTRSTARPSSCRRPRSASSARIARATLQGPHKPKQAAGQSRSAVARRGAGQPTAAHRRRAPQPVALVGSPNAGGDFVSEPVTAAPPLAGAQHADVAGDLAAPLELELAVAHRAGELAAAAHEQPLAHREVALVDAADVGFLDLAAAGEAARARRSRGPACRSGSPRPRPRPPAGRRS